MRGHTVKWAIAASLVLVVAIPVLGVVNGTLDTDNEYSNVCAIAIDTTPVNLPAVKPYQTASSGTLIHPRIVLTAGHTVEFLRTVVHNNSNVELCNFYADFTPNANLGTGTKYRIQDTYLHQGYTGRNADSIDVGLLVLKDAAEDIDPVNLPDAGYLTDLDLDRGPVGWKPKFIVCGYGNTEHTPSDPGLPDGRKRFAYSTFKSLRTNYLMLSKNFELGEGGLSRGDSGGPAFWEESDGTLVQTGIFSTGDHSSATYQAFVRTDVKTVIDFIQGVIDAVEAMDD